MATPHWQICVWCWHHIMDMAEKDDTDGRCPACRTVYDKEKIVGMASSCERSAFSYLLCYPVRDTYLIFSSSLWALIIDEVICFLSWRNKNKNKLALQIKCLGSVWLVSDRVCSYFPFVIITST